MARQTKREEAEGDLAAIMATFDADLTVAAAREGRVPDEWRRVWQSREAPTKQISIRVDADVLRFFRSLGPGYGPRMNRVLRAFLLARMAGFIQGAALPEGWREDWMARGPGPDEVVVPRALAEGMMEVLGALGGVGEDGK